MKITVCCLLFSLLCLSGYSQFACVDSSRFADETFQCLTPEYEPVCGCDGKTYRNRCAAEYWGGLINDGFNIGWTEGTICGQVDFDFNPTAVQYDLPVQFYLYMKDPGTATLYIYNRYGGLVAVDYFNTSYPDFILSRQYNFGALELGIYIAVVIGNGEQVSKKFAKVTSNK